MQSGNERAAQRMPGAGLYGFYVGAIGAALVGNLVIRLGGRGGWLTPTTQLVLAVLSAGPLIAAAFYFWRLLRTELDEMIQRVVLEGMAFALVVWVPAAALWANLKSSGIQTPRLDAPDIVLVPAVLVALGIGIAIGRFR